MKHITNEFDNYATEMQAGSTLDDGEVPVLSLDIKKYQSHVEDFDLTEEQKIELLQTLWTIMETFVDIGFGVDAVQLLFHYNETNSKKSVSDDVGEITPTSHFNCIAPNLEGKEG